jgi:hypothetical protein
MKSSLITILGALLCFVLPYHGSTELQMPLDPFNPEEGHAGASTYQDADEAVTQQVLTFVAHYIKTLESGIEAKVRDLFVGDKRFRWFTDGTKSYSSPDDVVLGMRRYAGITFRTKLSQVEVVPLKGNLASASATFETKLTIPESVDHTYGGVITWLLEKDTDANKWRVLLGHTSTPGGPPAKTDDGKGR